MQIDVDQVPLLARGCAVLGTGGGGETLTSELIAQRAIEQHGPVQIVGLDDLPQDGLLLPIGGIGAPVVAAEKPFGGDEGRIVVEQVERMTGGRVVAMMASEIGGGNGLVPIACAAAAGLPVVDADGIGRAFPEVQMVSMHAAGRRPDLIVLCDERENVVALRAASGDWAERLARAVTVVFGGSAMMGDYVMPVAEAQGAVISGSVTLALEIGTALAEAAPADAVAVLAAQVGARRLIDGKVIDVERRISEGFVRGSVVIEGYGSDAGRLLRIEIQNEFLAAFEDGRVRASVPDLICLLDAQSGEAIATELVRYGQRTTVIAFPCAPIWRTARGLEIVGPRAFGYDFDFTAIEELSRVDA